MPFILHVNFHIFIVYPYFNPCEKVYIIHTCSMPSIDEFDLQTIVVELIKKRGEENNDRWSVAEPRGGGGGLRD